MEDQKELVIIKILAELQEKYDINNIDVKNILDRHLCNYALHANETSLMVSDLPEKITFFLGIKRLEGLSEKSIKAYFDELTMFHRYCNKPVIQIDVNDIRRYFAIIQSEKTYQKTTINNKLAILRSFFGTLYREEIISKDPTVRLKNIKVDVKNLREHLTVEELEILRNACVDIREKSIIEFLYSTGVRVSEAVEAKLNDINWSDNSLVVHGKGDKYRIVFFSIKCKIYLQEYISKRQGNAYALFIGERKPHKQLTKSGYEKLIKRIAERTNISKDISPHVLRHTMATHALQRGMDITLIQQLLGHEQINTTQVYAKVDNKKLQLAYQTFMVA